MGYLFCSFLLSFLIGIPTNEPRFYYLSVLTLFISLVHFTLFKNRQLSTPNKLNIASKLRLIAKYLILILIFTYLYRNLFFIDLSRSYSPNFSDNFYLSKEYITNLILEINEASNRGESIETLAQDNGISMNRYLVWKKDFERYE
ncbi:hypothetical protein [Synechocystis sp. PCC 6714]|uniref:hypothetical protein n=1 Tax=Synechocystis sp. (strain PCC 6714) TaxID=1147 RepID=UPI0011876DAB|nr:hypothetical protein [Synechocystis sp. PCC 6714]